jgi:hypothetical protein
MTTQDKPAKSELFTLTMTAVDFAVPIGKTRTRVRQLVKKGRPPAWPAGTRIPLGPTLSAYLAHPRIEGRCSTSSAAKMRIGHARAAEIELRTAERARQVALTGKATNFVDTCPGTLLPEPDGSQARIGRRDVALRNWVDEKVCRLGQVVGDWATEQAAAPRRGKKAA